MKLRLALCSILSLAAGMVISDLATIQGFPANRYVLELQHEDTSESNFECAKWAAFLGQNLSTFDTMAKRQENCFILATGSIEPDGSFAGQVGWNTWLGRWYGRSLAASIPASKIKSIQPG